MSTSSIAAAVTAVTCNPLTERRCARPERCIASTSASAIAPSSPVASAEAMPPPLPGIRDWICAESAARRSAPDASAGATTSTGAKPLPVAPRPLNHAARAKS
ncbi:hypothetical protein FHR20_001061 [Sphingomonas leidyi]|uniref:Uncharacterized protein n=1 Tax=Sphingomonas leidyi TaxID=68569 RepID=A0A7X5UXM0_9SPHN|nr:hypothetical protein [Sphingomonas leidyi]